MNSVSVLSTTPMPASRGLPLWISMWGSLFGRSDGCLRSDTCGTENFDGTIRYTDVGALRLCKIKATPHRVTRSAVAPQADPHRGYKLVVQISGSSTYEQAGRTVVIAPQEWTLYDAAKPYRVVNPTEVEQYIITMPREVFSGPRFKMDALTVQGYSARAGVGRLACGMVRVAFEEFAEHHLRSTDELADTITRLFQQALLESTTVDADLSRSEILRERIRTFVQNNFRDPDLSIDRMARELNQTKRTLHRKFSAEGESISDFIWSTRLESSRRALASLSLIHRSITEVAYACGFSSSAHFSRAFRDEYGMSPREYRQQFLASQKAG